MAFYCIAHGYTRWALTVTKRADDHLSTSTPYDKATLKMHAFRCYIFAARIAGDSGPTCYI